MWKCFFFQAEDGIRDLVRSRGLGDVYKRQARIRGPAHLSRAVRIDRRRFAVTQDYVQTGARQLQLGGGQGQGRTATRGTRGEGTLGEQSIDLPSRQLPD